MNTREAPKHVYTMQPGEDWCWAGILGAIIVTHPDRPPKLVMGDGLEADLMLSNAPTRRPT